ncbi:hypothetical protein KKC17_02260 [Patescibacteria group bacterium]|nr:hypothetical protein [Patescibacteria group bacterium]
MPDQPEQKEQEMQQQYQEQLEMARRQQVLKQAQNLGQQAALGEAKTQAVQKIKAKIKKRIMIWLISVVASILGNPITWVILGVLIVIIVSAWCLDNTFQCVSTFGLKAVSTPFVGMEAAIEAIAK